MKYINRKTGKTATCGEYAVMSAEEKKEFTLLKSTEPDIIAKSEDMAGMESGTDILPNEDDISSNF